MQMSRIQAKDQSWAGPRLSAILLAVSTGTLERKTTRELQVPPFPGTMMLNAFESAWSWAILS
jgi:hypothetical protein